MKIQVEMVNLWKKHMNFDIITIIIIIIIIIITIILIIILIKIISKIIDKTFELLTKYLMM